MIIKILIDNNTLIGAEEFIGEPALSFIIEDEGVRVLFDTGYSDALIQNASKLNEDLSNFDAIVISHGHSDHTGGLLHLANLYHMQSTPLYAHPLAFNKKFIDDLMIGSPLSLQEAQSSYDVRLEKGVRHLTDNLIYLGEIPDLIEFDRRELIGFIEIDGMLENDYGIDDTALAYVKGDECFVITGCAHAGLANTIEYAKRVTGKTRVGGVIGGFHLLDIDDRLKNTITYLQTNNIERLYPSHCVSFHARAYIHSRIPIVETGVSMVLEI